jgi:hypothetical protein
VGNFVARSDDSLKVPRREADIGHWEKTLARHIWLLRRAGIASRQIEREVACSLGQCVRLRKLPVSASDEPMYARVLAIWRHECAYLDNKGQPRALRLEGRSPTFRSLVRAASPRADAMKALSALKRYRLVSHRTHGLVRLIADGYFPCGKDRGPELGLAHAALEGLTETCYGNLQARQPPDGASRTQRTAYTDYLDRRHLHAYEEFLKESAQAFLAMQETWLKRHEVKSLDPRRKPLSRVGVGVFAIRSG